MLRIIGTLTLTLLINSAVNPSPKLVFGQWEAMPTSHNMSGVQDAEDLGAPIVNIFLGIALSVSIIGIMFAGIKITWSKGDAKAFQVGKDYLNYSIRALLFSFAAIALEKLIRSTLGADFDPIGLEK